MNINNIGAVYHELTKKKSVNGLLIDAAQENKKNENYFYKNYDRFTKVKLPDPLPSFNLDLAGTTKEKELNKKFSGESITSLELSNLLFYAFGITRKAFTTNLSRRAYASVCGRYSLEVYILNFNIETLGYYVYHYNIDGHYLEALWLHNELDINSVNHLFPKLSINSVSCAILITSQVLNTASVFGSLGYKYIYFETGAVLQNINIVAEAQKLSLAVIEEIDEEAIERFLDIDGEQETLILGLFLGKK